MKTLEKPIVVNLFAGPGTGKSTMAAQIFSELKWLGINCEMTLEFAKEKVWEESFKVLDDQIYVFGKQLHKMRRLVGKVDVIITDSPLLFSLVYDKSRNTNFSKLVVDMHHEFNNVNFFLNRKKKYEQAGRMQDEEGAKKLDEKILNIIDRFDKHLTFDATKENASKIANLIELFVNQEIRNNQLIVT